MYDNTHDINKSELSLRLVKMSSINPDENYAPITEMTHQVIARKAKPPEILGLELFKFRAHMAHTVTK